MKDETYAFISDVKEKKVTARSARHTRTHCGKGGRVRLPSDNLSKKELQKMNGECKSYRLNEPMTREKFLSMPDDLKITYIKLIRNKYGIPDNHLAKAMGFAQQSFSRLVKRLQIQMGKELGGHRKWDKEGFYAWWHGVDMLPTPVPEETEEEPIQEETVITHEPDAITAEEIIDLQIRVDELLKENEELKAANKKYMDENIWLRNELKSDQMQVHILQAQMDVVRLIFGGKNNG